MRCYSTRNESSQQLKETCGGVGFVNTFDRSHGKIRCCREYQKAGEERTCSTSHTDEPCCEPVQARDWDGVRPIRVHPSEVRSGPFFSRSELVISWSWHRVLEDRLAPRTPSFCGCHHLALCGVDGTLAFRSEARCSLSMPVDPLLGVALETSASGIVLRSNPRKLDHKI